MVLIPGDAASRKDSEGERRPKDLAGFSSFSFEQKDATEFDKPHMLRPYFGHRSLETTFAVSRSMFPIFGF